MDRAKKVQGKRLTRLCTHRASTNIFGLYSMSCPRACSIFHVTLKMGGNSPIGILKPTVRLGFKWVRTKLHLPVRYKCTWQCSRQSCPFTWDCTPRFSVGLDHKYGFWMHWKAMPRETKPDMPLSLRPHIKSQQPYAPCRDPHHHISVRNTPRDMHHIRPATNSTLTSCVMYRRFWNILMRKEALNRFPSSSCTWTSSGGQPKERLKGSSLGA